MGCGDRFRRYIGSLARNVTGGWDKKDTYIWTDIKVKRVRQSDEEEREKKSVTAAFYMTGQMLYKGCTDAYWIHSRKTNARDLLFRWNISPNIETHDVVGYPFYRDFSYGLRTTLYAFWTDFAEKYELSYSLYKILYTCLWLTFIALNLSYSLGIAI